MTTLLKMNALLYAEDTLLLNETEEDLQRALNATPKYCNDNKMTKNVSKLNILYVHEEKSGKCQIFSLIELQLSMSILFATSESCSNTTPSKLQQQTMLIKQRKH